MSLNTFDMTTDKIKTIVQKPHIYTRYSIVTYGVSLA